MLANARFISFAGSRGGSLALAQLGFEQVQRACKHASTACNFASARSPHAVEGPALAAWVSSFFAPSGPAVRLTPLSAGLKDPGSVFLTGRGGTAASGSGLIDLPGSHLRQF